MAFNPTPPKKRIFYIIRKKPFINIVGKRENILSKEGCSTSPITRQQILDWSKLKQSADDNFEFDENIRKFSKRVENTVGKGEIACYEQFLLFPQCFQKACFSGASKGVIVWEWVKPH